MIHHIRIVNFKSLNDVRVDLSPVTVLVGKSGTGKSNFVHALRFLREVLISPQSPALKQIWAESRPVTNPNYPTRFELKFSIDGMDEPFNYQLTLSAGFSPVDECLEYGRKCLFHQAAQGQPGNPPKWRVKPELVPELASGSIALTQIPSISEVVIAYTALTEGIGCYGFSDDVLTGINGAGPQMSGLDDAGSNFLNTLKEIFNNLQDVKTRKSIVETMRRLQPGLAALELNNIRQPTHVVVGHAHQGKTHALQLSQQSSGFRRFFAYLLALYQRPPKQTLIFEHPEDGIHPGALSLLADEFKAAPGEGRGQVILTTHSPQLLDCFDGGQIRVVEIDDLKTRIGPVSSEQHEALRDKLLSPGELLTVDPARLSQGAAAP